MKFHRSTSLLEPRIAIRAAAAAYTITQLLRTLFERRASQSDGLLRRPVDHADLKALLATANQDPHSPTVRGLH